MHGRLARFMRNLGFQSDPDPAFYKKFHQWSIEHQEEFYAKALEDIKFPWIKKPTRILDYDAKEPIWKARWFIGGEANIFNACIEEQVRRGNGDRLALIASREDGHVSRLTFKEVEEKVNDIANHLKSEGIGKGDRVCLIMPSCEQSYLIYYAIHKVGAAFVPIPTEIMDIALVKRLQMTKPKIIFTVDAFLYNKKSGSGLENIVDAIKKVEGRYNPKIIEISYLGKSGTHQEYKNLTGYSSWIQAKVEAKAATVPLSSTDINMVLFTSGTTGTPKGTLHGYASLIEDMIEHAYASDTDSGDRFMWYTSPGWMMFPWLVTGANGLGATVVLYDGSPRIDGKETLLKLVDKFEITHLGVSPPLIIDILESLEGGSASKPATLREIRYTSAPLVYSAANRLAKFGYAPNGACGGTDGCFCYCSGNSITKRQGAKMMPGLGIDVHIMLEEKGKLREAEANEMGEIAIKSPFPSMTMGLLNDDNERSMFRSTYFRFGKEAESKQESRYWFHGDLADFDREGYITIHGRADDLLVVHGSKLSPIDVHDAVVRNNPEVVDAAPIAMSLNSGDGGELLVFAVLKDGRTKKDAKALSVLEERIKDSVKEKVNKFAKPYRVFFVTSLPYTINNKPAFRIIKRAILGEEIGDTSTIRNKESIEEILELGKSFKAQV